MLGTREVEAVNVIQLSVAKLCVSCETIHDRETCPQCTNTQNISIAAILKESHTLYTPPKKRTTDAMDS